MLTFPSVVCKVAIRACNIIRCCILYHETTANIHAPHQKSQNMQCAVKQRLENKVSGVHKYFREAFQKALFDGTKNTQRWAVKKSVGFYLYATSRCVRSRVDLNSKKRSEE